MKRGSRFLPCAVLLVFASSAGAMQITIVPGANLAANSDALASFQRAADIWDGIFTDPILVTINADLSTNFAPNIIGSSSSFDVAAGYDVIRAQLLADSVGKPSKSIIGSLPTAAQFTAQMPAGFSLTGNTALSKANAKAMGFTGLDVAFGASDGTITFNSNFNFYFGVGGSVPAGQIDFQSVATHELGHALGFFSAVDAADYLMSHSPGPGAIDINPLDMYRFSTAKVPSTTGQFTTNARDLVPGTTAFTSDTVVQYSMSTGQFNGDGRQASHWKDDALSSTYIGVMDPTLATGIRTQITSADIRALELIGYDVAAPEPGTIVLMAGAMLGLIAMRRKQTR